MLAADIIDIPMFDLSFEDVEQIELAAQFAVIALLCLLKPLHIGSNSSREVKAVP